MQIRLGEYSLTVSFAFKDSKDPILIAANPSINNPYIFCFNSLLHILKTSIFLQPPPLPIPTFNPLFLQYLLLHLFNLNHILHLWIRPFLSLFLILDRMEISELVVRGYVLIKIVADVVFVKVHHVI